MRAFIALPVAADIQRVLGEACRKLAAAGGMGMRWVPPQQIHLTLKFLGDIDDDAAPAVSERLSGVAGRFSPWSARLHGLGAFPNPSSPRVVWAGVDDEGRSAAVQAEVEDALARIAIAKESRPFAPHLTLGRRRPGGAFRRETLREVSIDPAEFTIDRLVLFQSTLTPSGAVHREVSVHMMVARA